MSLESGDVKVEGRIVDCSTGNTAAKILVGFGADAGSTTIDLMSLRVAGNHGPPPGLAHALQDVRQRLVPEQLRAVHDDGASLGQEAVGLDHRAGGDAAVAVASLQVRPFD